MRKVVDEAYTKAVLAKGVMKTYLKNAVILGVVMIAISTDVCPGLLFAQDWPEIFEPNLLLTLNIEMNPADWNDVLNDETFDLEKPAWFWADGEEGNKLFVSVRRKSGDPIPPAWGEGDPKISLKIDINEYIDQDWHGLIKLSMENGDDNNVLTEGIAANLHRMASAWPGYGYDSWRANWVKVYVNGHYCGVYVNAEHLDKRFLQNRGLYVWHETWLYQYRGEYNFTLEVGDDSNPRSPAVNELCYRPFRHEHDPNLVPDVFCDPPDDNNLVTQLNELVNMQGMLSLAAVDAFTANPDSLFEHQRNAHFLDFNKDNPAETRKRMYFPWDIDAAFQSTTFDIYGDNPTEYQMLILGNLVFRAQYDQIMCDLLAGPFSQASIFEFIDMIEPVLVQAVADDPYNQLGTNTVEGVAAQFDSIRAWLVARIANVRTQVYCGCGRGNLDGLSPVNFRDFAILANDWWCSGEGLAGDINGDETVNFADLRIIALYWLTTCE